MIQGKSPARRRGVVLPMMALCLIAVMGFLAFAIDIGLMAVAKNQTQNAADAAAIAGCRTLDGNSATNYNKANALSNAQTLATANTVLANNLQTSGTFSTVTVSFGSLVYDTTHNEFNAVMQDPPTSPNILNVCQVTVQATGTYTFATALGFWQYQVQATAMAADRPKDVALVLDFSGSMNNESDLWNCESYLNGKDIIAGGASLNRQGTSNNADTVYPKFGHYSAEKSYDSGYANYANLLAPSAVSGSSFFGDASVGLSNVSASVTSGSVTLPALVNDFYSNNRGATPTVSAFSAASSTYATTPGGDNYLYVNSGLGSPTSTYAATIKDIIAQSTPNSTTTAPAAICLNWETQGYKFVTGTNFNGYTVGPNYWGKTFYIWPPDPTNDWRTNFFLKSDGVTGCNDNTLLFTGSGTGAGWQNPMNGATIRYIPNYKNILAWIKNTGPNPFPSQLRSGGVLFYDSIPTDVPSAAYNPSTPNTSISWSSTSQRFWKEYIDWVIGMWRDPDGHNIQAPNSSTCSVGPDYTYNLAGTPGGQQSAPPTTIPKSWSKPPYMSYTDNPPRPRHRLWFGPMTMVQFMMDTGCSSGALHDISMYPMKQGVATAILNINTNHPSYQVAICAFNRPVLNSDNPGCGSNNGAIYDMSNSYTAMAASMWVPRVESTSNQVTSGSNAGDVYPWLSNGNLDNTIPRAHGDYDGNTASQYGMMMAYNQFSMSKDLQNNPVGSGGFGRQKAAKLVIFETDGMYNQPVSLPNGFTNNGSYNSYYTIRYAIDTVNAGGYIDGSNPWKDIGQVAQAICNTSSGTALTNSNYTPYTPNPGYPGYSTVAQPAVVQCIGFGVVFQIDGGSGSAHRTTLGVVQNVSAVGGTVFPSSYNDAANGWKWCIGTLSERQTKIKQAIQNIFEQDVPLALIK